MDPVILTFNIFSIVYIYVASSYNDVADFAEILSLSLGHIVAMHHKLKFGKILE